MINHKSVVRHTIKIIREAVPHTKMEISDEHTTNTDVEWVIQLNIELKDYTNPPLFWNEIQNELKSRNFEMIRCDFDYTKNTASIAVSVSVEELQKAIIIDRPTWCMVRDEGSDKSVRRLVLATWEDQYITTTVSGKTVMWDYADIITDEHEIPLHWRDIECAK